MSSFEVSKLLFVKAQLYGLDFANATFYLRTVSSVAKRTLLVREVWGSILRLVKSTQCRQRLTTIATFLWSCVAQALSRRDGPRNLLHASA